MLIWRAFLFLVAIYAINAIDFKPSFPYWETLLSPEGHPLLWSWGNFDGVHYLTIAKQGYSAQFTQAFFPLYPALIRYFRSFVGSYLISGLLISHLFLFLGLFFFYKLIMLDRGKKTARRTLIFLLLFPTSFYFGSLYSESLFLALTVASFYACRKRHWWWAGILGALASATRVIGIFLLPAFLVEWYYSPSRKSVYTPKELIFELLPIFSIALGLLGYMYFLNNNFSDPLLFLTSQPAFGAQRSSDKLIMLYQVFWRYSKMLVTVNPSSLTFYTVVLELISSVIFLVLSLIAFKKIRLSYAVFGALSFIAPTLTGTFSSMPRYVLVLFPSFMVLGLIKNKRFQRIWWFVSAILLAVNTALFVRGYWIA